jgi:hypothetical protein
MATNMDKKVRKIDEADRLTGQPQIVAGGITKGLLSQAFPCSRKA